MSQPARYAGRWGQSAGWVVLWYFKFAECNKRQDKEPAAVVLERLGCSGAGEK